LKQANSSQTARSENYKGLRGEHANHSDEQNVEIIDLTQELEGTPNPTNTEQTESSAAVYTATIT